MQHLTNRLVILAIISVVIILVAFLTFQYQENRFVHSEENQLFLPSLADKLENISTIEITQKGASLVIDKKAGDWVLAQQGGYQVNVAKVRQLVQGLSALTKIEAKTTNPERFSLLGLEAPSVENNAARVAIFDANGTALADVIIGSLRRAKGNTLYQGAFYIRHSNENQAWLVNGTAEASAQINDWMNRELLRLNSKHIAGITIDHPRSQSKDVRITRTADPAKENVNFTLSNLAKGKEVSSQMDIDAIVGVVKSLNFMDVVKTDEKSFKANKAVKTTYALDGNLNVILNIWEEKSKEKGAPPLYWISISYQVTSNTPAEAISSVTKRLAQYEGWLYHIGGYQGKLLTKSLQQLTKK